MFKAQVRHYRCRPGYGCRCRRRPWNCDLLVAIKLGTRLLDEPTYITLPPQPARLRPAVTKRPWSVWELRACQRLNRQFWWFGGYRNPIPNHLGCIKPCNYWDKLPTSSGAGFLPSTVSSVFISFCWFIVIVVIQ